MKLRTPKQILSQISRLQAAQEKLNVMVKEEYRKFCEFSEKEEILIEELEEVTGLKEVPIERAHEVHEYFKNNGLEKYNDLDFLLGDGNWGG